VLNRVPDDIDFHRMAIIVDASERPHLRGRVSRGMDVLQGMWKALSETIEPPALAKEDASPDTVYDLSLLKIAEKMPPLPE